MSRARHHAGKAEHHKPEHHKKRARGGASPEVAGGDPQVLEEAKSGKSIGFVEGERGKKRGDRLAVKHGGKIHHRAHGGRISPFSSAHEGGPKIEGHIERHGDKPVSKEEHGHAVKKELKRGGKC